MKNSKWVFAAFGSITIVILPFCNSFMYAQVFEGDSFEQIQENGGGEVVVAFYEEAAFAYYDENGQPTGVALDIIDRLLSFVKDRHNVELQVTYEPHDSWPEFYDNIMNSRGGVIGTGNVTITEDRKTLFDFSPPYLTNIAVLITHESVADLRSVENISDEFSGKTAVSYEGTTHEVRINNLVEQGWENLDIVSAETDQEVIDFVSNNPQSFGYIDLYNYWMAVEEDGYPIKRHEVGDQTSENFGLIMPSDTDWRDPVEEFFNIGSGFRATTTYRDILQEHLGHEVSRLLQMARQ